MPDQDFPNIDPRKMKLIVEYAKAYNISLKEAKSRIEQLEDEQFKFNRLAEKSLEIQREVNGSAEGYLKTVKKLKQVNKQINDIGKNIVAQRLRLKTLSGLELEIETEKLKILEVEEKQLKRLSELYVFNLKNVNKTRQGVAFIVQSAKDLGSITKGIKSASNFLKLGEIFKMSKSIKLSALQMGVLSKQSESFSKDIQDAAWQTNSFGLGIEDIAKIQTSYSNELSRTVMLGKEGAIAMGEMAVAAGLGSEGAGEMAASLDKMGYSAERTGEFVAQILNDSHSMGLNSTKVIKNIQQNIKLMNRYNFKNGVKGLARMAQLTTKMGVSMEMITPMADKLFDIEGAVEMSAQLQVLGGEWSKLADPFKLMYMARNDVDGLTESVIKAASSTAQFNSKTKEFDISAMELHRLRKVADATGLSYEELAQSARKAANFAKIRSQISFNMDEKTKDFIESTAIFDDKGKAMIRIDGSTKYLNQLSEIEKRRITELALQKEDMKKRAEDSQTFEDTINNTFVLFKQLLLPLVEVLNKELAPKVNEWVKTFKDSKFIDTIKGWVKGVGNFIASVGGFIIKWPKLTAALFLLFEAGKWVLNGKMLGIGFNSVANAGGGGIGGMFGGKGGGFGKNKNMPFGKSLAKGAKGFGLGSLLGIGLEGGRSMLDDKDSGLGKALGVGGTAASWGATGALLGSIIPGLGNVAGGLIGGVLGAGKGIYDEYFSMNDGIIKFNPQDKFMKVDDSTMIAGTNKNGNKQLASALTGMAPGLENKDRLMASTRQSKTNGSVPASTTGVLNVNFGEIKFGGKIELATGYGISHDLGKELLNSPNFLRDMTKMVHEQTQSAIKGGKTTG